MKTFRSALAHAALIVVALVLTFTPDPDDGVMTYEWGARVAHTTPTVLIGTVRIYDNMWTAYGRGPTDIELGA